MQRFLPVLATAMAACAMCTSYAHAQTPPTFTTLAGSAGTVVNSADGTGSAAQFSAPRGIAVDSAGTVYVADSSNHTIRKVTAAGVVSTLAGTAGSTGTTSASPARFSEPFGVAMDSSGTLYVADANNNAIRKISAAGVVSTLAGTAGSRGSTNGTGTAARFSSPYGVAADNSGNVYVIESDAATLRKITPAGVVTTLAGGASTTVSDCLFDWAERSYPQYFAPAGSASQTVAPYYFRYYAGSGNYLATNAADGHLWALGTATGGQLLDLGLLAPFSAAAGCQ